MFYDVDIESDLADPNLLFWYANNLSILLLTKISGFDQSGNFLCGVYKEFLYFNTYFFSIV